jgi:hypothetical protein
MDETFAPRLMSGANGFRTIRDSTKQNRNKRATNREDLTVGVPADAGGGFPMII